MILSTIVLLVVVCCARVVRNERLIGTHIVKRLDLLGVSSVDVRLDFSARWTNAELRIWKFVLQCGLLAEWFGPIDRSRKFTTFVLGTILPRTIRQSDQFDLRRVRSEKMFSTYFCSCSTKIEFRFPFEVPITIERWCLPMRISLDSIQRRNECRSSPTTICRRTIGRRDFPGSRFPFTQSQSRSIMFVRSFVFSLRIDSVGFSWWASVLANFTKNWSIKWDDHLASPVWTTNFE